MTLRHISMVANETWLAPLTIAAISQVRPDDVLLGEAEDPQAAPSHSGVKDNPCISNHLGAFIEASPGKAAQRVEGDEEVSCLQQSKELAWYNTLRSGGPRFLHPPSKDG